MVNLARWRQSRGLSQKEVAEALGVAQNTVSNWEKGKRQISAATLLAISSLFSVSVDEILGVSAHSELGGQEVYALVDSEYGRGAAKMLSSFEKLNERGRERAVQAVEDLGQIPRYRTDEQAFTLRVARSKGRKSSITAGVRPKTLEKLRQARAVKDEKDLK